jgi:hypothetical protein
VALIKPRLDDFDAWIALIFDQSKSGAMTRDDAEPAPKVAAAHLARLYANAESILSRYPDERAAAGLKYLSNPSLSNYSHAALDAGIPAGERAGIVLSMRPLFSDYFERHCSRHLSSLSEPGASALNGVCYMWWDSFPLHDEARDPVLADAVFSVISSALRLSNDACRESALHGLGHWAASRPEQVAGLIDGFLATTPNLRPELVDYARAARKGTIN